MIRKLDWDTQHFGYNVGEFIINSTDDFLPDELPESLKDFRLTYIFTKNVLRAKIDHLVLADRKVVLQRKVEPEMGNFDNIKSYRGALTNELLELSYQSGEYSRFRIDKFFEKDEFRKLYSEWVRNSLERKIARDVFVYETKNQISGFITLVAKEEHAEIGLIVVNPDVRGCGIGTDLVKYTVNNAYKLGYELIRVVTQLDNKSAITLYNKNGFELEDLTYVYHYWNI